MAKGRIDSKIYKIAMLEIIEKANYKCQNCGKSVPLILDCVAHVESKNGRDLVTVLTKAVSVCRELHTFSHTKSKNLKKSPCVKLFLERFGNQKRFFLPLWEYLNGVENV
jgi:ribosomal protein L31